MKTSLHYAFIRIGFCALAVLASVVSFAQEGQKVDGNISSSLQGLNETMNTFVAPPTNFDFGGERDVVISVTYNGFTTAAQNAFQYAVDIWASQLTSDVPILIDATWSDLPGNTLGSAGAEGFWYNFPGAPSNNVYYPSALADKLAGYDLDPGYPDVVANFDSGTDWYFGTDGNPAFDEFDFVSVVLHELGHGLGVQGSADKSGSTGYLGLGSFDYPIVYDLYVENGSGSAITSFANPSTTLGSQLSGNSLYWNGANALAGNSGVSPRMYAPSTWEPGSSYSHLNESTYTEGNANSLMTPQIGYSEAIHSPGPIILGLMADIGWEVEETGGGCEMTNVAMESTTCLEGNPIIQMTFSITGGCYITEICSSANGGAFVFYDVSALEFEDGGIANFTGALANTNYEFYYVLSDGTQSGSFFFANGDCDDVETICDCAGTEHTIGVLGLLGDGYADNNAYEWEGQLVDFECETWGYDCGDIAGSPTDDPYNTCGGDLPPNNGCAGGGDCSYNGIDVYIDGCGESMTDVMFFEFDYDGDCLVTEICYVSTFSAEQGCFPLIGNNLGSGDVWGINGLGEGVWEFYYSLDDGSSSPIGSLTITSCVQVEGCTNPYATNYNENADIDDDSCIYDDTICDCAGTEHTIGVVVWIGDGFADDNAYEWDGQFVDFECATWGYDCGDIAGSPNVDPNNVCGGDLPPNNGCEIIETPGCTDSEACNYDADATVDNGSCEYSSCAGCMNPSACNYDSEATLADGSCEFDSCAGCTNPNACNYDEDADLENGSCEYNSCAGCTNEEACNYDSEATIENGSCDFSCYGCTDTTALNYDSEATIDDGTCSYDQVDGCIDDDACNYNPFATNDDGSCEYLTCAGCTDFLACNFDVEATIENGTCDYSCYGCTDPDALNYDANATIDDGTCSYEVVNGCTDEEACNYNPFATDDNGSCEFLSCAGCTDPLADNYDSTATIDDGSCVYGGIEGCTDSDALNFDPAATIDDGSCIFNCDFPDITYTPFCEPGEPDVYYIEMDISDLGNGAPYLVTNNANGNQFEISFNGSIELGPFGNDIEVVILVSSLTLDGCIVSSPPQNNNCEVSVDELDASSFAIYPNPTNGQFTIQTNNFEGKTIVEILDSTGKLVESHQLILSADQNQAMDLSNLANGIYVIRLRSNETVAVDQLIIRR
jgi:hypothetical protein